MSAQFIRREGRQGKYRSASVRMRPVGKYTINIVDA
jgi:hypothetical protein